LPYLSHFLSFLKFIRIYYTFRTSVNTSVCFNFFNVYGSVHRENIPIYIQQDATLHCLFYLETVLNVSGGTSTHHQERIQLYLQHLVFVTPLLLPAAVVKEFGLSVLWVAYATRSTLKPNFTRFIISGNCSKCYG